MTSSPPSIIAMTTHSLETLELAVSCAASSSVEEAVRQQATAYCEQVRRAPDGWAHALRLFEATKQPLPKFYALSTLQEFLGGRRGSDAELCEAARDEVRAVVLGWLDKSAETIGQEESYIRTKLGVVVALLIKSDYPERWSGAFDDLLALLSRGPHMIDFFFRVLHAVDEEIVSFHADRDAREIEHNVVIKDTMRASSCVRDLCAAVYEVVASYHATLPELASLGLRTLRLYIGWIDINHVVNERFLPLLLRCLQLPPVQLAACECVYEIVTKGMDDGAKLLLLHQLQLFALLEKVPLDDEDFAAKVAEVVNAACVELLQSFDRLEVSRSDDDARMAGLASTMLHQALPLVWACLGHDDTDVAREVVPTVMRLLQTMKRQVADGAIACADGAPPPPPRGAAAAPPPPSLFRAIDHVARLLEILREQMKYPPDFCFDPNDELEAEDEEFRKQLRTAFMKCARICPRTALAFVCATLSALEQPLAALPFFEVECALRFVFHFSEGVGAQNQELVHQGPFRALVLALHRSDISAHAHPHVVTLYYELAVRYVKLARDEPPVVQLVLEAMCGARGLQHPSPMVRSRVCYFLLRLTKALGAGASAFAESIVTTARGLLQADPASTGLCESDSLQLFETMGCLVGLSSVPIEQQAAFLEVLIAPHLTHIESTLRVPPPPAEDEGESAERVALSIAAIANTCKGFTRVRVELQPLFSRVAQVALSVLRRFPTHPSARSRIVFLLHRLVVCLGGALSPYLRPMLSPLMVHCDSADVIEVVQLANQLCLAFQDRMLPALDPNLVPFLRRVFELMPPPAGGELSAPHEATERASVQRLYFLFLNHIVSNKLAPVLVSPTNASHFEQVLNSIVQGLVEGPEPAIMKSCLAIITLLVQQWQLGAEGDVDLAVRLAFHDFVVRKVLPAAVASLRTPSFDARDANSNRYAAEIASLLFGLASARGPELVRVLVDEVLPPLALPPSAVQGLAAALSAAQSAADIRVIELLARR